MPIQSAEWTYAGNVAKEVAAKPGNTGEDDLLRLAMSRPGDAVTRATRVLAGRPDAHIASIAHQAIGIVLRDNGDVGAAIRELRTSLRLARQAGSAEREADVLASLGAALVHNGRTTAGLAAFDRAIELASGRLLGRVLHRRGSMLWFLGRHQDALDDLRRAVGLLERSDDLAWTALALGARGLVHLALGFADRADADLATASRLYAETGQELQSVHALLNRGVVASRTGDLPRALALFDEATDRYRLLGVPTLSVSQSRCIALLAAGLVNEAFDEAEAAVLEIELTKGRATRRAGLLRTAATCALAAGKPQAAAERARAAHRLSQTQRAEWGSAHSGFLLSQAEYAAGGASGRLLREAAGVVAQLEALGSTETPQAHLLAGRVALDLGNSTAAERHLAAAERSRRRGPAISRATGWLSAALRAEAAGEPRRMLIACRRGLEVLDQHRWTLGSSELRAHATAHGSELAGLALRYAAQAANPRLLLGWTERWRATALTVPSVRPAPDKELTAGLTALRGVVGGLEEARLHGAPTAALEREQLRLESAVRDRSRQARGSGAADRDAAFDVTALLGQLSADVQLVEIVDVDGVLHVLVCGDRRVRQFTAGRTADASRAAEFTRFALRRLARGRNGRDSDSALAILRKAGPQLQEALLGPAVPHLRDGPVVIVPPGRLHGIPWALLPALQHRPFSVAPSASSWMRACSRPTPTRRNVVLARGPGLATDGAEVPMVAELYGDVTVLSDTEATAGKVLSALDGAWLGHIAAHGTFRGDSPMFSSLRMHDGPLTVYDFEQLDRAPHWLVLSSCDSGALAPAGADELLGLASSLLPLGTTGIVAGVVQLNDYAVVPLMLELHRGVRAGHGLAEALYLVRQNCGDDPAEQAAALSLLTLGAG
jgi:tetratricopeptide (TPR) repeat protein